MNATQEYEFGLGLFFCPTALDAYTKSQTNISVYRYEYFGDWPNLRLYPTSQAYHTSETSMIFGTMADISGDPNTALQVTVSDYMQHAWTTFARDPVNGLEGLYWPEYNHLQSTLVRLGYGNETVASFASPASYDSRCPPPVGTHEK
jgi:carboxylesterase type B